MTTDADQPARLCDIFTHALHRERLGAVRPLLPACLFNPQRPLPRTTLGTDPDRGTDRLCSMCIEAAYDMGEISQGWEYQYINLR